jgi:hypothetical protein
MITILRRRFARNNWVATLKVKVTPWPWTKIVSGPLLGYLKLDFTTISHKWLPYWDDVLRATFGSLPWRSRSQHDLEQKSCPAHNLVIWSRILKLFLRNVHHIETTCRAQHLGGYLEGQDHSMTLNQNRVRPITWSRILQLFYRNDHQIDTMCRTQHLGHNLKGQGHSVTLKQNCVRPITSLFEVGFYNYFSEMITILIRCVPRNIWVATLKVKVTTWHWSKIVSGP